jgi:RNA polymerase sigma-70 factor (family 1)
MMKDGNHSDQELVRLIRCRDRRAFNIVYQRHWLRLYRTACKIVHEESVAEDVIQDTFVALWEKGCFQEILNLEAYLYQVVKLQCLMHLRSGHITKKHLDHFAAMATAQVTEEEEEYAAKQLEELLQESINNLPEKCREVYYLSRVEDLPNKMIAERLHISTKTVENHITKALRHLRVSLDKLAVLLLLLLHGL